MKTILITGASSGIGYQAAKEMINKGYKIIAPCRDINRGKETLLKFEKCLSTEIDLKRQLELPILDLASFESIEKFCNKLILDVEVIDRLVLNAGLQYTGSTEPRWSSDGFELTFAVNHLSHQYITQKILPLLYKSDSPRIVITSSEVHNPQAPGGKVGELANLGELKGIYLGKGFKMIDGSQTFNADKAYKDSKLCNILFARELFRRLELFEKSMPVLAWAPGLVIPRTNKGFFRYSRKYNEYKQRLFAFMARDIFKITETEINAGKILCNLSTQSKYDEKCFCYRSNQLIRPGKKTFEKSAISVEASNDQLAKNLWKLTNKLICLPSKI